MKRKGPRGLTPEERALWDKVKSRATPLNRSTAIPTFDLPEKPNDKPSDLKFKIPYIRVGETPKPTVSTQIESPQTTSIDKNVYGQIKRGKRKPEAKLDLHGMTLAQAHPRLIGFVSDAYSSGKRLVLVITGKGKDRDNGGPIPTPLGILRHHVPGWLNAPPLKSMVLDVVNAHIRHGGDGAYYVYLRRRR